MMTNVKKTTKKAGHTPAALNEKAIMITGGGSGIGQAAVKLLSSQGASVFFVCRDAGHFEATIREVDVAQLSGKVHGIVADLSTESGVSKAFSELDALFGGRLDVLINNAAVAYQSITDGSYQDWAYAINTNLLGYLACSRGALERMLPQREGHIINVGSMSADVREQNSSVYVAAKSAIQGFSEALRKEVNADGIKVTLIEPGSIATNLQPYSEAEMKQKVIELEMLRPEDLAASILYTLSQAPRCDVVNLQIKPHLQII